MKTHRHKQPIITPTHCDLNAGGMRRLRVEKSADIVLLHEITELHLRTEKLNMNYTEGLNKKNMECSACRQLK